MYCHVIELVVIASVLQAQQKENSSTSLFRLLFAYLIIIYIYI